jgi:hypothetical protein
MNQQHSTLNLTLARVTQAVFASSAVWPKISANAADIQETDLEQLHSSAWCILAYARNADEIPEYLTQFLDSPFYYL